MKKLFPPLLIAFVAFVLCAVILLFSGQDAKDAAPVPISILVCGGEDAERWQALEQGVRQACREVGFETPTLIAMPAAGDGAQLALVERELAAGARGLLIVSEDASQLDQDLSADGLSVPAVCVKSGWGDVDTIAADSEGMARLLAERMAADGVDAVVLLDRARGEGNNPRRSAFLREMGLRGIPVTAVLSPGSLGSGAGLCAVALDTDTLERLCLYAQRLKSPPAVYGIGGSPAAVHALDEGVLSGLVYENEYALGYVAAMRLASRLGLAQAAGAQATLYLYADPVTLYQPDVERLLFPLTQ